MIGSGYFHNHFTATYGYSGNNENGWSVSAKFIDAGFASDDVKSGHISTEGELHTRYMVRNADGISGIKVAVEVLLADLNRMGITAVYDLPGSVLGGAINIKRRRGYPIPVSEKIAIFDLADSLGWEVYGIKR